LTLADMRGCLPKRSRFDPFLDLGQSEPGAASVLAAPAAHLKLTREARQAFQPEPVDLPARKSRKLSELIRRHHLIGYM